MKTKLSYKGRVLKGFSLEPVIIRLDSDKSLTHQLLKDIPSDYLGKEVKVTVVIEVIPCQHNFVSTSSADMQGYCTKCGSPEE